MIYRPSKASPSETKIVASVARPNRGRPELGVGPVDGSVSLTMTGPKELFARFVSPCTGRARPESAYVDAANPLVFQMMSTMLVENGLTLRLSTARILVWLANNCTTTVSARDP